MRVLIISHLYPSRADSIRGTFVHSQVLALQELGCDVKVLAPTALVPFPLYLIKDKWRRFHETPKHDIYQGVDVIYPRIIRTPGALLFELAGKNYYHALKPHARGWHRSQPFQLIHAQVAYPDGWAAAALAAEMGLPLVLTLHGQELQKIVHWGDKLRALVEGTLARAGAVVVPSAKMLTLAEKHGVPKSKLHLVYNGLDALAKADLPQDLQARLRDKQILLSVCHLEPEKGVQHNIEAVALLKDQHPQLVYLVVGDGSYRTRLQELAQELEVQDRVIFAGRQPRDKVGGFYQAAHVFSMPSRDESFGIVYLEAMAAGLPVIGTLGEGIEPIIREHGAGRLVKHGDVAALAQEISNLLDPALETELGNRGKAAAARFTWQDNARQLLEIYSLLV